MKHIYLALALRNVFRQKLRTLMTLTAIVSGVAGLIVVGGFVQDIFIQLGEAIIHSQTGHIQVFKQDFLGKGSRQPEKYVIEDPKALAEKIGAAAGVDQVSARLSFAGLLNNGRRDLAIIGEGIEPDKENKLGTYMKLSAGRNLRDSDRFGMLIGQGVARSLGLKPGDHATLVMNAAEGALNSLEFEIVGVFQSFSKDYDARAVRIGLAEAQELMHTDGANLLVVSLQRTEDTDQVTQAIQKLLDTGLDARNWRELSDFYDKTIDLYDRQFGVLKLIILCMVLLSVVNSVNMSTFERTGEFGTMQALGNRSRDVFQLLMIENLILGTIGASIGVCVGVLAALSISAIGVPMPPPPNANVGYTAFIRIVPHILLEAWIIGIVATVLAAILPARKATRMPVIDALRQSV